MAPERPRLDVLLVERGLAPTREKAKALVLAGEVLVDGERVTKAGTRIPESSRLELARRGPRWASRAGGKLVGALDEFDVDPGGLTVLDIGASTGGFTHVLLERGAACVVAVDVGYGQLDWKLREDGRVRVLDRVNARHMKAADLPRDLPSTPALAVVDVSFISLKKVLPAVARCLSEDGQIVALVKPQFEAGPDAVGKGGIVRDPGVHREVLTRLIEWARTTRTSPGDDGEEVPCLGVHGVCASPVRGAAGNQEFFLWMRRGTEGRGVEELHSDVERLAPDSPSQM